MGPSWETQYRAPCVVDLAQECARLHLVTHIRLSSTLPDPHPSIVDNLASISNVYLRSSKFQVSKTE